MHSARPLRADPDLFAEFGMAQHLTGIAVQDAGGADLGRRHLGQVGQRGLDRQQRGLDLGLIGAVDAVKGKAVGGVEGPRPDAAQMRDMARQPSWRPRSRAMART